MKIILASASPRRKELLGNMGFDFEIRVSDCNEDTKETNPTDIVEEISLRKAEAVYEAMQKEEKDDCLIIAADTLVFLGDKRLGKPLDEGDAAAMLRLLSGREHNVITGVTLIKTSKSSCESISFHDSTAVWVSELSEKEILDYISTGEPMDKAGSYAIQGMFAKFIQRIDGDYSNVVGLPVAKLYKELINNKWI